MGRIPEEELERIKRANDLVALVRASGVELRQQGKDLVGSCPFHAGDDSPSLTITPEKRLWHCFGCGAAGDVIEWVRKTRGLSFLHAVEVLRAGGPPPTFGAVPVKASTVRVLPPPVELDAEDHALMLQVIEYYHATLKTSPEALAYLKKRSVDNPEAVTRFKLGYANRTLGLRLPTKQRADGLVIRERLERLGIYRSTGREHFCGCLVFHALDEQGHVGEMYGRKIVHHQARGLPSHLYLPGPHRGVWNLDAFRQGPEVILCEALIDALTFYCHGFPHVTASYGVQGFTADHLAAMKQRGTERVLIAYDNDDAGNAAAKDLAGKLAGHGITSFRVRFPHGVDANLYACTVKPPAQALAVLLRSAEHLAGPIVSRPIAMVRPVPPAQPTPQPLPQPQPQPLALEPASSLAAASQPPEETDAIDLSDMIEVPDEPPTSMATLGLPAALAALPPAPPQAASPAPVAATPIPEPPRSEIPAEVSESEVVLHFDSRRWRIRGLGKNLSFESMRVNVLVGLDGHPERFHQDTLDLYSAKQRQAFIRTAAVELGTKDETVKKDIGTVLLKLEELQERAITKALEPKQHTVAIAEPERRQALELLEDPKLLARILEDFEKCGVVGEETNKLVGYLAAVSRKLERPLAVMVQSSSAAGKSALMNASLAFVPEEERVAYSAMTGQSLFYMAETDLKHKVLAIAEEEGAERASYALKQLQSEGALSIASTGKDPTTGRLVTHEYRVEGPAAIFMTTTAIDLDEELMNRCLVLTVNEDREQTRAIHRIQRQQQTLAGLIARRRRGELLALHHNAQRLLRPLPVFNPYADSLTFLDDKTRMRRDHLKYLGLIEALTLLHQHQREHRTFADGRDTIEYVVTSPADIEMANQLASEVLGHTLDELPPQTRRFLLSLDEMVRGACQKKGIERSEHRFSRSDARQFSGWSLTQVKAHLDRLAEMEYVLIHHGSRGQSFVYELLWAGEGQEGKPFLMRLLDVETLAKLPTYGHNLTGENVGVTDPEGQLTGPKRGHDGVRTGGWRTTADPREARQEAPSQGTEQKVIENTDPGGSKTGSVVAVPRRNDPQAAAEPVQDHDGEDEDDDFPLLSLAASSSGRRRP
jgi:DNA primase